MKRIILLINLLTLTIILHAQEKMTYELNGKNIEFTISQEEIYVEFSENDKSAIQRNSKEGFEEISNNSAVLKVSNLRGNFNNRKQDLKKKSLQNFQRVEPVLIYSDGTKQIAKGELSIKLKDNIVLEDLLKGKSFTSQINEFDDKLYLVKLNLETSQLFKLVNNLQNDSRIEFVEPNFIRLIKPHTNDPFFASQWAINNQGYLGGTIDADMDVEEAWAHSTGSGIKVAIIDTGVDLIHPDLQGNLLSGYDATGGASNGNQTGNPHGTACAGIVAATANNSIGVTGVAYNAKLIPVKIFPTVGNPTDNMIANGINWAWQNGADVLSNSYGGGSFSSTIESAINNAVNHGRNGKGSIVLFSSGNDNAGVSFPANVEKAIAVGASSMCDERKTPTSCDGESWWGSNFGNQIDVVAPGVEVYTTRISGTAAGDYWPNFNGTSSACPNAAGVAALVLSINPNFTQTQVREILETTTDKIGNTPYTNMFKYGSLQTWNNEVGFGRLNAYEAVQKAINYDNYYSHYITGPTQITPGTGGFYKITNPYAYATNYVWNIPTGCYNGYCWEIVQGQGTSAALIHGGSTGLWDITCKIYNGSTQIGNYYITVNVQNPYNGGGGGDPCNGEINVLPTVIYPPEPCDNELMGVHNNQEKIYFKKVFVFNMLGQAVIETNEKQEVDISYLNSGMYIIKAELSNNEIMTKKILKE